MTNRVVIVGAGLLGAAAAYRLAQAGAAVTIVEAGLPGSGTSGRSFAWLNAQDKAPNHYFALNVAGLAEHRSLADEIGTAAFHPGGDVLIGTGATAEAVRAKIQRHREAGYPVRELTPAELARLEPDLAPAPEASALGHFPDEGWIDATVLVGDLLRAAVAHGAVLRPRTPVSGLETEGDRIMGVRLGDGEVVAADTVVLAAGPLSERLAGLVDVSLPMANTPGLLAITEPVPVSLSRIVHAGDFAARPDGGGRLMLTSRRLEKDLASDVDRLDPESDLPRAIVEAATQLLPGLAGARVEAARVGMRSVPKDGQPVIGAVTDRPGLYLLVTHSGATLAPLLGRLVAKDILAGPEPTLEPYRPREPAQT